MDGLYITLEEAKAQCIIDQGWTGDDKLISDIILDVEAIVESDLCVPLSDLEAVGALPRTMRLAMLLLIASYYKNREDEIANSEATNQQNGYKRLISNYRNYAG